MRSRRGWPTNITGCLILVTVVALSFSQLTASAQSTTQATAKTRPLFAPAPDSPIAIKGGPGNVTLADLDDDGKLDLLVACGRDQNIHVLRGQGDGRFAAATKGPLSLDHGPGEMELGDLNGDKNLDLAIANHDSYGITLLLGDGKRAFEPAKNSPFVMKDGQHPHTHGLALGDLNNDGNLDIVTANSDDNDVSVALGDGSGSFSHAKASPFAVGKSPYPLTLGDVNHDGHLDIVATNTGYGPMREENIKTTRALTILLGDGRGAFRRTQAPLRTQSPWFVAIGDMNGDAKRDIVATHAERSELTVLIADDQSGFIEAQDSPFDLGHSAWHISIIDANGDGKGDVAAAADNGVRVMLGDGRGRFTAAPGSPFATGKGSWRMGVGDVNSDGKPDIVTSNLESDSVSVLLAQ